MFNAQLEKSRRTGNGAAAFDWLATA